MVLGPSAVKVTKRNAHIVPDVVQGVANAAQAAGKNRHGPVTTFSGTPKR